MEAHINSRKALSPKQREVADHIAQGKSNREIAALMGTKLATVRNQTHVIYAKLGVYNRYEVISMHFKGKL